MLNSAKVSNFKSDAGRDAFISAYNEAMALLPTPTETKDVKTDFGSVRVYYFVKKENEHKEPIVLLPGRSAATPMWEPNIKGLIEDRPVYSIDTLGEPGLSVQTAEIKNKKDQADWLNQVLIGLNITRAHLITVSMGGWITMNLARFYPTRIASVSLLDPVFVFVPISIKVILLSIPATVPIVPKPIREKMLSYISGGIKADETVPVAKLIEFGMRNFKIKLPPPDQFTITDLQKINTPVLAFMAENSTMHDPKKAVENGRRLVSNITIEIWPNASHALNGEYPNEINERILQFIKQNTQ